MKPGEAPPCTCGHSKYVHFISATRDADGRPKRTTCSSWHGGRCRCTAYTATKD